ncbi:apolipoprotein N-acyltransferase [Porphyrobacter sp. CACIAM 03H1]|jgi:apolipoprotein N-acyltransferase|uniref:apolipoprotein N-acyltransferase n=1 Tax=Porphyrobacter sp. CACIAM 03H1 TaxID=2003315 RepID=UPI000B5A452B|nr:apolipoprotein N-acyltransferase [Porphyrobacter sp. CACIAM 03H1]ASJ89710.1 apolipoprotein N-acyltransferase [Porphyrobacter sp. CACIAM 03H1]
MMERLAAVPALAQRRPALAAILLGLVAACAYPPLHLWPLGLAALAGFVWLIHSAEGWRQALWRGWWFGWAHLTLANNWIATAFTHQAKMPEFLGWLAVPLLCIYLAWYPALAALAAHGLARKRPLWAFGLVLAGAWIVTEWLRGWVFTGYPWPPVGLMLLGTWDTPGMARLLPFTGTYALSGLALLIAAMLLAALASRRWLISAGGALALTALMVAPSLHVEVTQPADPVEYTLVQPHIPQSEINDGSKFEEQFARLTRLTAPGQNQSRIVLWPESAVPDYLEEGYPDRYYFQMTAGGDPVLARKRIGKVIGPQSTLLTGVVNLNIGVRPDGIPAAVSARNSVMAIDGAGAIVGGYDKAHLVPYGEYLPMRPILEPLGLSRLVAGSIDYLPGPGPRTLDLGEHGKAGVMICYEIVFSGAVAEDANRPDYIFNPSNDGWFGAWGPPQHLAQARMRAIEEGLPVLRSTTTGISAVIDANGVVRGTIGMGKADKLEGFVPAAAPPTLFARWGHGLTLAWAALLIALGLALPRVLALARARG